MCNDPYLRCGSNKYIVPMPQSWEGYLKEGRGWDFVRDGPDGDALSSVGWACLVSELDEPEPEMDV